VRRPLVASSLALLLALVLLVTPALAITHGQPDGDGHPYVGALVGTLDGVTVPYCSGTLIAPDVFLTAAHCYLGTDRVALTFDSEYTPEATLHYGTFHGNPLYRKAQSDPHDIAVVVLDAPVDGIEPAQLPGAGLLKTLGRDQQFTTVGYGAQEPVNQPGGPVHEYRDVREFSVSSFNALNPGYLRLSQNPARGDGGACYGDSGGPNFIGAGSSETKVIAAITITGDAKCKATNVTYRLDTESARAFLEPFVTPP
jgi:secreted trypsin-like serine protease